MGNGQGRNTGSCETNILAYYKNWQDPSLGNIFNK